MADGTRGLSKGQLGREATAGTAVAATTIWRGPLPLIDDQSEVVFDDEDVGFISGVDRSHIPKIEIEIAIPDTAATFEQLPHLLEMGIKGATATQDGAGSDYIYAYPFPTTTVNTIKTYTIEAGDNNSVEEVEFCYVPSFALSGVAGEALMMTATVVGRQTTVSSFTGGLSIPTTEDILFSKGKFYSDAAGGTIGTTQISSTLLAMQLDVTTGLIPKFTADGNLHFTFVQTVTPEILLDLTLEHNAAAAAFKVDRKAETTRLFRLIFEGSAVATPGTTYSFQTLIIDGAFKIESVTPLGEQDGNNIINIVARARYNGMAALFASITVVNELSALP